MADCSSLLQNVKLKKEENVAEKFPYRIFNDLSKKLKAAEATILKMLGEREAREEVKNDEINNLKRKISELAYENNRYHLAISNCTFCASDDPDDSDASSSDASITASIPVSFGLPSSDPGSLSSPIPALMPGLDVKEKQADTVMKRKDKSFINRMAMTLAKLEAKYQVPEHKRKKRLFSRKQRTNPIVPKELASIYHGLAAPEPDAVVVPDPFPQVRWNDVRFKPGLPNPEPCPVHSCSPDPAFYAEDSSPLYQGTYNFWSLAKQYGRSFGTLPGYKTNLGVVAVPTTPVGGYVYCPEFKKWVIHAVNRSSAPAGKEIRKGGGTSLTRRRKKG